MNPSEEYELQRDVSFAIGICMSVKPEVMAIAALQAIKDKGWIITKEQKEE
jgi:hypothetical protein